MSIVKMDMSEYEALKKVESTLEQSLSSERVLRQELADAQDEIINAAKANEKSVTIVEKVHTVQTALVRRPDREMWGYLDRLVSAKRNGNLYDFYGQTDSDVANHIVDTFFTKKDLEFTEDKLVTRRGFDEVIKEIQDEVRAKHIAKHGNNLKRLESIEVDYQDLSKDSKQDKITITELRKQVEELELDNENLKAESLKYEADSITLGEIYLVMGDSFTSGFGANKKRINKIKEIVDTQR